MVVGCPTGWAKRFCVLAVAGGRTRHLKSKMEQSDVPTSYTDLAKSLHERATQLDVHLRNLSQINDELKDRCEKALAALKELCGTAPTRVTCCICYSRDRTHAILPCGHGGLCEACSARVIRRGRCHSCRAAVESSVRIFL